jgi:hypothetical protein
MILRFVAVAMIAAYLVLFGAIMLLVWIVDTVHAALR